jgi:hypothetical protein
MKWDRAGGLQARTLAALEKLRGAERGLFTLRPKVGR